MDILTVVIRDRAEVSNFNPVTLPEPGFLLMHADQRTHYV